MYLIISDWNFFLNWRVSLKPVFFVVSIISHLLTLLLLLKSDECFFRLNFIIYN